MMTSRRVWALTLIMASATLTTAAAGDLKFLPSDTEMVFTINVKQILGSQLLQANKEAVRQAKQELENQAAGNPAMKLLQKAGFDIFRDLHKITVTSDGSKEPTGIIVEGNFDKDKLAAATAEIAKENRDALAITKSGKQTIYEITPPGDKAFYATLANENVMIAVSTRKGLTDALDRLAGDQKANLKKEFAALLNGSDGKQSIFFVATGAALTKLLADAPVPNAGSAAAALQTIDGLAISLTVADDLRFEVGINAKNEADAKKMAKEYTSLLPVVQFAADNFAKRDEKFAPLGQVAKTLQITTRGTNVVLGGTVSSAVIESVMKNLPQ